MMLSDQVIASYWLFGDYSTPRGRGGGKGRDEVVGGGGVMVIMVVVVWW